MPKTRIVSSTPKTMRYAAEPELPFDLCACTLPLADVYAGEGHAATSAPETVQL